MANTSSDPSFDPGLSWPVISRSIGIGRWWLPGWWRTALIGIMATLALGALCLALPANSIPDLPRLFDGINPIELLGISFMLACMLIGILFLAHLRRQPPSMLSFYPDRLEIARAGEETEIWNWSTILTQPKRDTDVWIEAEGSGRSSYSVICFQLAGKKARTCKLPLRLNPVGPAEPTYANLVALRRAMLLGMLYCQPTLRIDWSVYKCCEISPRTLMRQRWPKWIDYGLGSCAMAGLLALLLTDAAIAATLTHPWLSVAAFSAAMIALAIGLGLLYAAFAPDPEADRYFGERHRRLMAWRASVARLA